MLSHSRRRHFDTRKYKKKPRQDDAAGGSAEAAGRRTPSTQIFSGKAPVDEAPEIFKILGAGIAYIDVIRMPDRTSVVEGKSVSVSVDIGGCLIMKTKKNEMMKTQRVTKRINMSIRGTSK